MKKLVIVPLTLSALLVFAQNGGAPDAIKAAFKKSYPAATQVKFEKEGTNYEVSYKMGGKDMSAVYDAKGGLLETEESVPFGQVPAAAMRYFNAHYKGVKIKETARITNNKGMVTYEIGTKGKDIIFDAVGKFVKEAKD